MSEKNSTFVKKDSKLKKIFKKIFLTFLIFIVILITSVSGYAFAVIKSAPDQQLYMMIKAILLLIM